MASMEGLSSANTQFALELFRRLSATKPSGNVFFSPLSISSALAMVYLGAKGETASQMAKVAQSTGSCRWPRNLGKPCPRPVSHASLTAVPRFIGNFKEHTPFYPQCLFFVLFSCKDKNVHSSFEALNSEINKPAASYLLKLANRLYGEKTFNFLQEFLESTRQFYHADLVPVSFAGAPEESRKQVNIWVEEQTEGKIQDLLKPGTVDPSTILVLVNAIYFKGNWMHKFDEKNTKEMPFKINKNESKPVMMMYQIKKFPFNYVPELNLQVLELPYVGEELSMFILLPEEISDGSSALEKNETKPVMMMYQKKEFPYKYVPELNLQVLELPYVGEELSMFILLPEEIRDGSTGLEKLEKEMTLEKIHEWTKRENMDTRTDIKVHLPKFKLEDDYELKSPLASLGMVDVFDEARADLSGMNGDPGLFLSNAVHKSFVEVNEEGTEAAAATEMTIMLCCLPPTEHFTADHPFLFFIRHNKSKSILFFGRYSSL
ncbi:ILEU inhibitor, partial [Amia calva]|nr:ILEU inhibitor [Amia calva]